jgi:hypothetical protein
MAQALCLYIGSSRQEAHKTYPGHYHLAFNVTKDCLLPGHAPQCPLLLPHGHALRHAGVLALAVAGEEKPVI